MVIAGSAYLQHGAVHIATAQTKNFTELILRPIKLEFPVLVFCRNVVPRCSSSHLVLRGEQPFAVCPMSPMEAHAIWRFCHRDCAGVMGREVLQPSQNHRTKVIVRMPAEALLR